MQTNSTGSTTLRFLRHETDAWKRQLAFISEEHIQLKRLLADALAQPMDSSLLLAAEQFHTDLLREGEILNLLRNDVSVFDEDLQRNPLPAGVKSGRQRIGEEINAATAALQRLKDAFNRLLPDQC